MRTDHGLSQVLVAVVVPVRVPVVGWATGSLRVASWIR